MKQHDPLSPIVLNHSMIQFCLLFPAPFIVLTLLLCLLRGYGSGVVTEAALCITGLAVLMSLVILLISLCSTRVTVSTEGVVCEPRRRTREEYFWSDFHYVYMVGNSKTYFLLFSRAPLDVDAQIAAYRECRALSRIIQPVMAVNGCMLLDTMLAENDVKKRLPPHITVVPKSQCAYSRL